MSKISVKIGFVPSYRKYGPVPEWVKQMRKSALDAFSKVDALDLVVPQPSPDDVELNPVKGYTPAGCVGDLEEAEVVAEYFMREKVDAVMLAAMNFGDERSSVKIAEKLNVPVLLYATKEPPADEGPSLARISDSYCGTLSIAAGLHRRQLPFHYAGIFFHEEKEFLDAVNLFVRAIAVTSGLKNAQIGQVGVRPPTFETVGYDEIAMARKFQQNVVFTEVSDIVMAAKKFADDDPVILETFDSIKGEVAEVTVADDWILKAAKLETAFSKFWTDNKLSAMSIQCWPSIMYLYGVSTCALFGRLTGKGMLTACETDTMGALAMLVNYHASLGETLPHFVDWTIQHRENPNMLLSWHCGNAPVCLAKDPKQTALRSRMDMKGENPPKSDDYFSALYQFQLKSGDVTFCRLAEFDGNWKMLIAPGKAVPSDEVLAGTWSWVEVNDHQKLYRTLVENGFIHHASMIHGDQTEVLALACKLLDIEPVIVR